MSRSRSNHPTVQELFDLTGQVALVTGASGHLGGAPALALVEAGASVVVSSRDPERASEVAADLPSPKGAKHFGAEIDHMSEASARPISGLRGAARARRTTRRMHPDGLHRSP